MARETIKSLNEDLQVAHGRLAVVTTELQKVREESNTYRQDAILAWRLVKSFLDFNEQ